MSKQSLRGIGFALLGWMGGAIMNLIAWLVPEPPTWLSSLGWILLVIFALLFLYGLALILSSYRNTQVEIQAKGTIISEQRERLARLRERISEPNLLAIPHVLTELNKLNEVVSASPVKDITEEQLKDLESHVGRNISSILAWLTSRKNMNKLLGVLITLSTEMNSREIGLRADRLAEYEVLLADLDKRRETIGNPLLKRRIREYLSWSDGLYSFRLFLKYHFSVNKLPKWFPNRLRVSDDKILLAIDAQMDEASGQVVKTIEESLIGRSNSGTGNV